MVLSTATRIRCVDQLYAFESSVTGRNLHACLIEGEKAGHTRGAARQSSSLCLARSGARVQDLPLCHYECHREPVEIEVLEADLRCSSRVSRRLVSLMSMAVACASGSRSVGWPARCRTLLRGFLDLPPAFPSAAAATNTPGADPDCGSSRGTDRDRAAAPDTGGSRKKARTASAGSAGVGVLVSSRAIRFSSRPRCHTAGLPACSPPLPSLEAGG